METKGKTAFGTVDPVNDGAASVVALGKRNPLVADALDGTGVADVPVGTPTRMAPVLEPVVGPVAVPPSVPVHAAPIGQHATLPDASRAQA
jgi:hypothetical protein